MPSQYIPKKQRHRGYEFPYRALAAAIILQAVRDVAAGRQCNKRNCKGDHHRCRKHAAAFFATEWAEYLCGAVDMDIEKVREAVKSPHWAREALRNLRDVPGWRKL